MIKIIIPLILFSVILSGCAQETDYIEPEDRIIVSAMGVQSVNNEMLLTIETVNVGENSNEDTYSAKTVVAKGKDFASALKNVSAECFGKLIFSQCPTVLIGTDIKPEHLREFYEHCIEEYEISFSVNVIAAASPYSVLTENSGENKLIGYEIFKMLKFARENIGETDSLTRILNINREDGKYRIPLLTKTKESLSIKNVAVFAGDKYLTTENKVNDKKAVI